LDERQVEMLRRARDLIDELLEVEVTGNAELIEGLRRKEEIPLNSLIRRLYLPFYSPCICFSE